MFDLETAANPQKLHHIAINPINHIKKHNKIKPYQNPIKNNIQHFHEFYRRIMQSHL